MQCYYDSAFKMPRPGIGEYLGDVVDETASVGQYVNVRSEFVDLIRFICDVARGRRLARSSAKKTRREQSLAEAKTRGIGSADVAPKRSYVASIARGGWLRQDESIKR